jgi:hypothetical protein
MAGRAKRRAAERRRTSQGKTKRDVRSERRGASWKGKRHRQREAEKRKRKGEYLSVTDGTHWANVTGYAMRFRDGFFDL